MSKDIKKALEHCVEWKCDNCPNRDELGSGETVCRGRLLPEVLGYVADLEAKLAEKDKENDKLIAKLEQANEIINNPDTLIFQQQELIDNLEKTIEEKNKEQNQKAIEQLEKVKEKILSYEEIYYQFLESGAKVPVVCIENFRVRQTIDNQINELKGKV